jgi:hypothetical protein
MALIRVMSFLFIGIPFLSFTEIYGKLILKSYLKSLHKKRIPVLS